MSDQNLLVSDKIDTTTDASSGSKTGIADPIESLKTFNAMPKAQADSSLELPQLSLMDQGSEAQYQSGPYNQISQLVDREVGSNSILKENFVNGANLDSLSVNTDKQTNGQKQLQDSHTQGSDGQKQTQGNDGQKHTQDVHTQTDNTHKQDNKATDSTDHKTQDTHAANQGIHKEIPAGEAHVKQGDSLWKIASEHLGKGASNADILKYTEEIAAVNFPDGKLTHVIHPGDTLQLPAQKADGTMVYKDKSGHEVTVPPGGEHQKQQDKHDVHKDQQDVHKNQHDVHKDQHDVHKEIPAGEAHVKQGDSLWKIASEHLGKGASNADILKYTEEIAAVNFPDGKLTHVIHPGDTLQLPAQKADGTMVYKDKSGHEVTVPPGGEHQKQQDKHDVHKDQQDVHKNQHDVHKDQHDVHKDQGDNKSDKDHKQGDNTHSSTDQKKDEKKLDNNAEKKEDKPEDIAHNKDVQEAHQRLNDAAEHKLKEPELSHFKQNMEAFEKRAQQDKLDPKEVSETYKQVERMMDADGDKPLSQADRMKVATEVMQHAAHPAIDQGNHNTCNVTTVESRTYTRSPSEAARLVADVSLTGEYKAHDGTVVKANPAPPDGEAALNHTTNGKRDYASEIFQTTAVNLHYQKDNPNLRYEQEPVAPPQSYHDTGERLRDYSDPAHPKDVLDDKGKPVHAPNLNLSDIVHVSNAISGKNEKDVMVAASSGPIKDVATVKSETELNNKLAEMKAKGELPAIVQVFCANEPFHTDAGGGKINDDGCHVVTVTDYKPGPPAEAVIQNQWGRGADHDVSVHDLYKASKPTGESWKELQKDVDWNRSHNQVEYSKEFELLEAKKQAGVIKEDEYEKQLTASMKEMKNHFEKDHVSPPEQEKDLKKLADAIGQLHGDGAVRMATEEHKAGLSDEPNYEYQLALAGWQSGRDHNNEVAAKDPQAEKHYQDTQTALRAALSQMQPAERQRVLNMIIQFNRQYT